MCFLNALFDVDLAGFWYAYAVKKQRMDAVVQWFQFMQASVWQHLC